MATAIRRGSGNTILYTAGGTLARGDLVDLGEGMWGVVTEESVANGATTEVDIYGLFEVTKTTAADTWAAGDQLAITTGTVAVSATGLSRAYNATTNGATTAWILLNCPGI